MMGRCFIDGVRGAVRCPYGPAGTAVHQCDKCTFFRSECVVCEGPYITQKTLLPFIDAHCKDAIASIAQPEPEPEEGGSSDCSRAPPSRACAATAFSRSPRLEGNFYFALYHKVPLKVGDVCPGTTVFEEFANRHHIEAGLYRN